MLIQDQDFACNPRHCYGIGPTDVLFRQFQRAINNAASFVRLPGWKSIAQDGKISSEVTQGLLAIAQRARGPALEAFLQSPTYATAAQLAPELIVELAQVQPVLPPKMPPPAEPPQAATTPAPTQAVAPTTTSLLHETPVAAMPQTVPTPMAMTTAFAPTAPTAPVAPTAPGPAAFFQKPAYMLAQSRVFSKVPWFIGGVAALGAVTALIVAATTPAARSFGGGTDEGDNSEGGDDGGSDDRESGVDKDNAIDVEGIETPLPNGSLDGVPSPA